jgi:hypothetical protein
MDMDLEADAFRLIGGEKRLIETVSIRVSRRKSLGVLCGQILFTAEATEEGRRDRGEVQGHLGM